MLQVPSFKMETLFSIIIASITTSGNSAGSWYQERPFNSEWGWGVGDVGVGCGGGWGDTFSISVPQDSRIVSTADKLAIIFVPAHLQGARNVTADALSRLDSPSPTEWRLPLGTSNSLFSAFGAALMNMFATAENKVTPIYVSPYAPFALRHCLGSRGHLHIVGWLRTDICIPSSSNRSPDSRKNQNVSRNDAASQHPTWHPLLLQLSVQPCIPLLDVELFQFIPNHRRPQYQREPSLLDLAASATSSDNITSPSP